MSLQRLKKTDRKYCRNHLWSTDTAMKIKLITDFTHFKLPIPVR